MRIAGLKQLVEMDFKTWDAEPPVPNGGRKAKSQFRQSQGCSTRRRSVSCGWRTGAGRERVLADGHHSRACTLCMREVRGPLGILQEGAESEK